VPILLLSQCLPEEMETVYEFRLTPLVSDVEAVKLLAKAVEKAPDRMQPNGRLPVFLKIDTGMGRAGCRPEDAHDLAEAIIEQRRFLRYAGTITHFAVSDSAQEEHIAYTHSQIAAFNKAVDSIRAACLNPGIVTAANSGGSVSYPDAWFDMVRPGIILYGYQDGGMLPNLDFEPVMELVTQVVCTKTIHKGESVSYGRTWTAPEDTVIGVLPIGYADGLPRILSGNFSVAINGKLYPLAGRICMDQCMVNLGANPDVKRWDEVTVFGGPPPSLNAADIAARIGTIPYEVTCNINQRVPRQYIPVC
jgi:alanine racemase